MFVPLWALGLSYLLAAYYCFAAFRIDAKATNGPLFGPVAATALALLWPLLPLLLVAWTMGWIAKEIVLSVYDHWRGE